MVCCSSMMTDAKRPLIVGNWKMHGDAEFVDALLADLISANAECVVCPPALWLERAATRIAGSRIQLGAQDCVAPESGAHTGDISAAMLKSVGCTYVIVGHSERRHAHRESDIQVKMKAEAVEKAGLSPIVCVGESLEEREEGRAVEVVTEQVLASIPEACDGLVVAYEPVWAIGTGKVPSNEQITEMHLSIHMAIRAQKGDDFAVRVLYGGSVKPKNATEILSQEGVDGALVGGASLQADSFLAICEAI